MAAFLLSEPLTKPKAAGILLAVCGACMIIGTSGSFHPAGVLCSAASVLGWSFVSVLLRKGLAVCDPLIVTKNALGLALRNGCFPAAARTLLSLRL